MNLKYPFDASFKHHVILALGLALWVFAFLYFTEPMDINEFSDSEKLIFLPIYGLITALAYLTFLPFQHFIYTKSNKEWKLKHEVVFHISFLIVAMVLARLFYLFFVVPGEPNPYSLSYHIISIFFPAISVILPILIIGRFAFGKYKNKLLEEQKIGIQGEGQYEGLRLLLKHLICIQSSDNYIEVFHISGNQLKKTLIRNKLSTIADDFPELLRTHRSYVINPFHFQSWKTEKGKHSLILSYSIEIPISKTYLAEVKVILDL